MTPEQLAKVAALNDLCRSAPGVAGRLFFTEGIHNLPDPARSAIMEQVETFNAFTPDNDSYGEHDFGAFDHNGERIFWKIDYYDKAMEWGSDEPWIAAKTTRVLTVMLADEY